MCAICVLRTVVKTAVKKEERRSGAVKKRGRAEQTRARRDVGARPIKALYKDTQTEATAGIDGGKRGEGTRHGGGTTWKRERAAPLSR